MGNPFEVLLSPATATWLTAQPWVLQVLKATQGVGMVNRDTVGWFSFLGATAAVVVAQWGDLGSLSPNEWYLVAGMVFVAWLYCDVLYRYVYKPMAASNNPLVPAALRVLVAMGLALMLAGPVEAAPAAGDMGKRLKASIQAGGIMYSDVGDDTPNWSGLDASLATSYHVYKRLSLYGGFHHGFPMGRDSEGHRNFIRTAGTIDVYPGPWVKKSPNSIVVGTGWMWFGENDVKAWSGYEAHVKAARTFSPGWALYASYSHGFAAREGRADVDLGRLGISRRVWP